MTHDELCLRAEKWLRSQNCGVVFHDKFCPVVDTGEQPDAIGWRRDTSILIECKATRSDFLSDRRKKFRQNADIGMGDWRFYMCPPDVIKHEELPEGWGLLYAYPKMVKKVHGVPGNSQWVSSAPFSGNKLCEQQMMYSALRRYTIRGLHEVVYLPMDKRLSLS